MTNLKKFEDLVPGDKILYRFYTNAEPELGVFSHFCEDVVNGDVAYFKRKDGQIMSISPELYEESCSAFNESTSQITREIVEAVIICYNNYTHRHRAFDVNAAIESTFKELSKQEDPEYAEFLRLKSKFE